MAKYNTGEIVNLLAQPDPGFKLKTWVIDGKENGINTLKYDYEIPKDAKKEINIGAIFEETSAQKYPFTAQIIPGEMGIFEESGSYEFKGQSFPAGEKVNLNIIPNKLPNDYPYILVEWEDKNKDYSRTFTVGTENNHTATMRIMPEVMFYPTLEESNCTAEEVRYISNFVTLYNHIHINNELLRASMELLWNTQSEKDNKVGKAYCQDMLRFYDLEKAKIIAYINSPHARHIIDAIVFKEEWNLPETKENIIGGYIHGGKIIPEIESIIRYQYFKERMQQTPELWESQNEKIINKYKEQSELQAPKLNDFVELDTLLFDIDCIPVYDPLINREDPIMNHLENQKIYDGHYYLYDIVLGTEKVPGIVDEFWNDNNKESQLNDQREELLYNAISSVK